jgi:Ca2+-binding EF-hand superfamily protein
MLRDIGRDPQSQISFDDFLKIMTPKMGDRNSREEINKV